VAVVPGRPLKSESGGRNKVTTDTREREIDSMATEVTVCRLHELPPGEMRLVEVEGRKIGVFHAEDGELYAIEDRCSHDDGPLAEGEFDCDEGVAICPRHGANIDIRTGRALTLPAVEPVQTFPVHVRDGWIKVEIVGR